ncbi:MAG: LLM class flavin-dependent oxidoreductase [Planctomycetes bacterium]|nr:LLM class flavin-dependent oxidoreductase [Planctomycetota bacterium]
MPRHELIQAGMFLMPVHDPAKPMAQCFDEDLELVVRCEELGFTEFWVGEHHSSTYENIVMPEIFIGKALGMTRSIRLGAAPVCLQYHHPQHVASRLAFLDHLSHGRLNVCFGPGAVPTDVEMWGVDPKQSGAMVAEAIDIILKLWTSEPPYEINGQFWRVRLREHVTPELGIGSFHKPLQRPYPPIHVPCINRNSAGLTRAGARGFLPISHHMASVPALVNHWETYAAGARCAGRDPRPADWKVSRNILVADTTAEARRFARSGSLGRCIQYILDLTRRWGNIAMWKRDPDMSDADCNLDYFMNEVVIAGDPPEVTRQLLDLRSRIGPFGRLVLVAHDWDDRDRWLHNLELFANEVVPSLTRQIHQEQSHAEAQRSQREETARS